MLYFFGKIVLVSDLDSPNRLTVVIAVVLTSQLANHQNCPCSTLFKTALFAVVWHVTQAATQWPCAGCEEGYRPKPVDWLTKTPLISQLAIWLTPSGHTQTCSKCPNTNLHLYEKRKRKGTCRTNPKSFSQCNVNVWVACRIHTNWLWREKFSLPLEEQLKGAL